MASESQGAKGQPYFASSGAPAIDVDPGLVADYAAKVGNYVVGTTAQRGAGVVPGTSAPVWEGLHWYDTDEHREYRYAGTTGGWERFSAGLPHAEFSYAVNGHPNATLFVNPGLTMDTTKTTDTSFAPVVASRLRVQPLANGPALYLVSWVFSSNVPFTGRTFAELTSSTDQVGMRSNGAAGVGENKVGVTTQLLITDANSDIGFSSFVTAGSLQNLTGRVYITRLGAA